VKKKQIKIQMLSLIKVKTKNLSIKQINKICKIKMQKWKFNFKSQKKFLLKNYDLDDIHQIVLIKDKIVGYNCLKFIKNLNKTIIIFDSLIIDKNYRGMGISNMILLSSINEIKNKKKQCYLYSDKSLQKYYEKFGWVRIDKKNIKIVRKNNMILMKFQSKLSKKVLHDN
tara:strand:+ start:16477 stop:16986 length:510 start_codon:yes stop_codon:yes gene_type:complete